MGRPLYRRINSKVLAYRVKPRVESRAGGRRVGRAALRNAEIAELLAIKAEKESHFLAKALRKASRLAFTWPEQAATILGEQRSLTELPGIGPYLAKRLEEWIDAPPEVPAAPEIRRNFFTLAEAGEILTEKPGWAHRYKGDLQMHTVWSDGSATISEMAEAGMARGYEYIAITDHSKGLKIAGGIDEAKLRAQGKEIESGRGRGKNFESCDRLS